MGAAVDFCFGKTAAFVDAAACCADVVAAAALAAVDFVPVDFAAVLGRGLEGETPPPRWVAAQWRFFLQQLFSRLFWRRERQQL